MDRILLIWIGPFVAGSCGVKEDEIGKGKEVESEGEGSCDVRFRHQQVKNRTRFCRLMCPPLAKSFQDRMLISLAVEEVICGP